MSSDAVSKLLGRSCTKRVSLALLFMVLISPLTIVAEDSPAVFSLWEGHAPVGDGTFQTEDPQITVYRTAKPNRAAMVICPGGGYGGLVMGAEGSGIAEWLNQHGLTGVVLKYRLPRGNSMVPLLDAQRAIRMTRFRCKEWGLERMALR